jgi:hypothetical protein
MKSVAINLYSVISLNSLARTLEIAANTRQATQGELDAEDICFSFQSIAHAATVPAPAASSQGQETVRPGRKVA